MKQYYRQNGIPPGVPTQKGSNADPYQTGVALPNVPLGNYDVPSGWPTAVRFNPPGDVPGPPVQFESEDMGEAKAGFGFESDHTYEGDWFFFHTDHLGSTSYLTDTAGNVNLFVCYTPYGEAIVDEHLTTYENPFKFSGKELDDITGLYDHGARSRNPVTTLWYGVDILWEKHPEYSPFIYCAGNPVRFIDPDGKDFAILLAPKGAGGNGHMAAIFQYKEGNCFYFSGFANEDTESFSDIFSASTVGCSGGVVFGKLMTNDIKNEVNNINNYETYSAEPYTESLIVQTTPEIDDIIYNNAVKKAKDINEGKEKYNILTNNCSQMVIDCIQKIQILI